jgi:crotonobetainyl-CoA:carnitine CoA-transferase CaiB-like acyl-CoA transferase
VLNGYRVLDLTDERGQLCGAILASLGAEVILVEPPGGSSARALGPFAGDREDREGSLWFRSFNRGKQSVVLDLAGSGADRETFTDLVRSADFLVESFGPGGFAALGFPIERLAELNPALISASISAFGADGPKAHWHATDLTIVAASGQMSLTGDDDRAPQRIGLPQAYFHPSIEGAAALLIALYERQHLSGLGQHIDLSAQQSVLQASQSMMLAHPLNATKVTRVAGGVKVGPLHLQLMWPCQDGYASVTFLFGAAIGPFTKNLMSWICEEGFCDEATRDKDWVNFGTHLFTGVEAPAEYDRLSGILAAFFATKTKAELLDAAFSRRLLIVPVTTIADVLGSPQLAARDYWQTVDGVRYPGPIAKFSATPLPTLPAAPALGSTDAGALPAHRPLPPQEPLAARAAAAPARTGKALEGLKVLDLMWVMAGPAGSRLLADYGATVVRVESANRVDTARTLQPFVNDGTDFEGSGLFNNMNAGKLGLALDMTKPGAKDVIHDLVRWADVVLESFSPRAMKGWGLGFDALREIKPDLIMLSSCLMGQTGPYSTLAGFGTMAAAISGFFNIVGWPDRAPCGPFGAYTDYVSPRLLTTSLMAAIEHRRQTGEGQYIDLSQAEASLHLLAPALLDSQINGRNFERRGNDDDVFAPHGVYRCAGQDEWVAVAVTSDSEWQALCGVLGSTLGGLDAAERLARRRELDEVVGAWAAERTPGECQEVLQAAGVPSHQVQNTVECFEDPQLVHRRHFREVEHGTLGTFWVEGTRFQLSRTPAVITQAGPATGQHTVEVLTEVLGYDGDRIGDLFAAELLE